MVLFWILLMIYLEHPTWVLTCFKCIHWSSNSREFVITLITFELGALIVGNLLLFSFWSSNYGSQPLPSHLQDLEALNFYKAWNLQVSQELEASSSCIFSLANLHNGDRHHVHLSPTIATHLWSLALCTKLQGPLRNFMKLHRKIPFFIIGGVVFSQWLLSTNTFPCCRGI